MTNLVKFTPDRDRLPMTTYSPQHADEVIQGMCNGELLSEICEDNTMPLPQEVRLWAATNEEFGAQFHRAMEQQAHMLFEEAVLVGRNAEKSDNQTRNRNHIDVCLKAAGKLHPKVYGDKSDVATVIPIQIITNLGDGKHSEGVGHGVYKLTSQEVTDEEV